MLVRGVLKQVWSTPSCSVPVWAPRPDNRIVVPQTVVRGGLGVVAVANLVVTDHGLCLALGVFRFVCERHGPVSPRPDVVVGRWRWRRTCCVCARLLVIVRRLRGGVVQEKRLRASGHRDRGWYVLAKPWTLQPVRWYLGVVHSQTLLPKV